MQAIINENGKKVQLLYVLWVLENYSDKDNPLKQEDIVKILEKKGYKTERKSVRKDLIRLSEFGYRIHGLEPELDEYGNELPLKRGNIWIEKEISDEQLTWLIEAVKYNAHINNNNKKSLIDKIISIGSKTFKERHSASVIVDGGNIFEVEGSSIFEQLKVITEARNGKDAYKIKFKYGKMAFKGNKVVYEEDRICTVSPYWVVVQKGNTYLIGYNHDENKIWHFRVDKMRDVQKIKSYAKPKSETELKGVDVGKYVLEHPLMFSGELITVELKVNKNQIGGFIETFGTNFSVILDEGEWINLRLRCGALDMFYWAIQFGDLVEVLSPQDLRDKIRIHTEGMVFKYQSKDGDKYTEAIKTARRHRVLNLQGIDLSDKTKHFSLANVKSVYLSNNNIDNIDFVKKMPFIQEIRLENNNISDLTPLKQLSHLQYVHLINVPIKSIEAIAELPIRALRIDVDETADISAIQKMKNLTRLSLSDKTSFNPTLKWSKIDRNVVSVEIFDESKEKYNKNMKGGLNGNFPYNVLKKCFGEDKEIIGDLDEIASAVNKMFDMLTPQEKQCAELIFKNRLPDDDIRKQMKLSWQEYYDLEKSVRAKIFHTYFNKHLEGYVREEDHAQNRSIREREKEHIIEKLRKRGFVVLNK